MANTTAPRSSIYSGWFWNAVNGTMDFYERGTLCLTAAGNDLTVADALTATGLATSNSLTVTTGAVSIDEIAYTFPATDGANTEQLTTNGSGTLAWIDATDGIA